MASRGVSPLKIYRVLYDRFGPQGWWPVTRRGCGAPMYVKRVYSGRTEKEKFEICVGAILTQNTAWKNVELAIANLCRAKSLAIKKIAGLHLEELKALIRPSGFYNQKAVRLKEFAGHILKKYGGRLDLFFGKPLADLRRELLSLNGIGPETADSIALYAAGKPAFVIDAYTLRIGRRVGWFGPKTGYNSAGDYLVSRLPESLKIYNEFHALIVAAGKEFCRNKPLCARCVLKRACDYGKRH